MIGTIGTAVLLSSLGWSGHHKSAACCCDVCGVEKAEIHSLIANLQRCPRWRQRHNAAHDLRKYDWECHPEIINALTTALLVDCDDDVREEAAQSLRKLAACTPTAHAALDRAAHCDPDWGTRFWARRALAVIKRNCDGACAVCRTGPGVVVVPGSLREPFLSPALVPTKVRILPAQPGAALLQPLDPPPVTTSPAPFAPPQPESLEPSVVPPLEGPAMREGKRTDGRIVRSRLAKLIPGMRPKASANADAARPIR
jgi:hypothetical protein